MAFTLNFDGRAYEFEPFITEWDVFLGMMDPDSWPTVTPPSYFSKFNNVLSTNGTITSLFDIFKPTWERLREAGVDYTSTSAPAVTVSLDDVESSLYYTYAFDHTKPNEIWVELYYPGGQQSQTFTFNYMRGETEYDRFVHSLYCIQNNIVDCPDPTYEGCSWFALGCFNPYYVYQSTTLSGGTEVSYLEGKPLTELLPADVRVRGADPYSIWDYSYTNGFDRKDNIYPQPSGAGFINALMFNNATADEILVNDEDLEDLIDPTSPDSDFTNSNNWSPSNWHEPSDYIGWPAEITNDALSMGFIHAYYLTPAAGMALSSFMLTPTFIENVQKLFGNPIDYIMGLALLPIEPANTTTENVLIGGVDTQISGERLTKQFQYVDMGSINVKEKWGGFPDYSTKLSLYLPFVGIVPIDVSDAMNGVIHLKYRVDLLTGECVAMVLCDTARDLNAIVYHHKGLMSVECPITNADYSQKVQSIITGIGNITGAITAGASGNAGGAVSQGLSGATSLAEGILSKPIIQRTGSVSGTTGIMDVLTPYLIIERPVQALPSTYQKLEGFSSCQGGQVSQFSGYLEVIDIDLSGIACTDNERSEIEQLMKGGVFV